MHWNGVDVSSYHLVADFCEYRHQTTSVLKANIT